METAATSPDPARAPLADWRNAASYAYTRQLTRDAWAYEFLRRNRDYRSAWHDIRRTGSDATGKAAAIANRFGLMVLEHPERNALEAKPLWRPGVSKFVLPLRAEYELNQEGTDIFDLSHLSDHAAARHIDGPAQHILFFESGRRLQLAVHGEALFGRVRLLTDAPLDVVAFRHRMSLLHRLADLIAHGRLAPRLYPPEARGRRLGVVLRVLDGWLSKTSQRQIGEAVFDGEDIERAWRDGDCPLRDRVRLTLRRGRWLMDNGYRNFLH